VNSIIKEDITNKREDEDQFSPETDTNKQLSHILRRALFGYSIPAS